MEEKKYPVVEEEDGYGVMTAEEQAVADAASQKELFFNERNLFEYPKGYDPGIGPYTIQEMNERIDRVERDRNNPDKWVRVDDFWTAMQREHLWLQ